jgi:hypothetical protein
MAKTSWTVTSMVTGQTVNDNAGNTVVGTYVYFTTGEGNQSSVFVADTQFNPANVARMVREAAITLDEVGRLSENA